MDGKSALIQACQHSFPSTINLLCSNHMSQNIKDKLHELNIPENVRLVITKDIFGKQIGSCHYKKVERPIRSRVRTVFCDVVYHVQERGHSAWTVALTETEGRSRSSSNCMYNQYASESVTTVLKSKVNYKKSELPVFIDKLKEVIKEQDEETERAVISHRKHQFCSAYKHLERDEQE